MINECGCGSILTEKEKGNTGIYEGFCAKCCSSLYTMIKYYRIPEPKLLIKENLDF